MIQSFLFVVLFTLAGVSASAAQPLAVAAVTKFTVENDDYRLVIDAAQGGSIRSFVFKPFDVNAEWIYPAGGGLLQDMIWQQQHPGEL